MKINRIRNKKGEIKRSTIVILVIVIFILAIIIAVVLNRYLKQEAPPFSLVNEINVDGGLNLSDLAIGMVYDSSNDDLFATGFIAAPGDSTDIWIAKYDSNLVLKKNITVNGSDNGNDAGYTMDLDGNGNLFIVGYISEISEKHNIWLAKYDLELNLIKNISINGPIDDTDEGYGLILDQDGNVYIAGTVTNTATGYDIYIAKYDNDLVLLESIMLDGPSSSTDKGRFLAFDNSGYLYVSGSMSQPGTNYDIWLGKFDSDLNFVNQTIIAGPTTGEDKGYGLYIDGTDTIYFTGTMTEPAQGYNIWLAKYTTGFNLLKNETFDGPANGEDVAYSIFLSDNGYLYLAGVYTEIVGGSNALLAKFSREFELINYTTVNHWSNAYDTGYGLIKGSGNYIYVSGFLSDEIENGNIWLAKYEI